MTEKIEDNDLFVGVVRQLLKLLRLHGLFSIVTSAFVYATPHTLTTLVEFLQPNLISARSVSNCKLVEDLQE